ncbi:hypothetical protein E1A91_1Z000500v1 [Gossypium mustelinum]|uniref:Secreted protein n=1 Tax=Gossypium mustelinum TaxID=34275 RepID=A0A5C7J252_GOSMU|nr:hypothetical protein E1A91_1Z002100v1 [Gossypium mustelinum]TXG75621.1 hypothetical protein E1A91_1Z000500v1 [Gossypium mustelinum]
MGWFRGFWIGFLSCTKCFDALWFCYSPVHQLQQYYRGVVLDNCYGKWSALWDCLYLKTKPSSQLQVLFPLSFNFFSEILQKDLRKNYYFNLYLIF